MKRDLERELERDLAVLLEAVRAARCELAALRDPQRNTTAERAVRRLSRLLEGEEIEQAIEHAAARLRTQDSPPIAPTDNVDFRVPYPWRAH